MMATSTTVLEVLQSSVTLAQTPHRVINHFTGQESPRMESLRRRGTPKIATNVTDTTLGLDNIPFLIGGYDEYRISRRISMASSIS